MLGVARGGQPRPARRSPWPRGSATSGRTPAATSRCSSRSATGGRYQEALEAAEQARLRLSARRGHGAALPRHPARAHPSAGRELRRGGGGGRSARWPGSARASAGCAATSHVTSRARALPAARTASRSARSAAGEALRDAARSRGPGRRGLRARRARLAGGRRRAVSSAPPGCSARRRRCWERTGGRLGGNAVLEGHHPRSAATAASVLGAARYAELHAGGRRQADRADRRARLSGDDALPGVPGPRPDPRMTARGRQAGGLAGTARRRRRAHQPRAGDRRARRERAVQPARSPTGCSSPGGPWTRTSTTSTPSSASPRGCS